MILKTGTAVTKILLVEVCPDHVAILCVQRAELPGQCHREYFSLLLSVGGHEERQGHG